MKRSVRLFQFSLLVVMLTSCREAASPTPVATLIPSPELQSTSTNVPTAAPNVLLTAGQWNYLFYHPQLNKVVLVNGGPDQGKPVTDPLELWTWDGTQWSLLSADPQGPVWRNFAGAAYDSKRNRLVNHGGVQGRTSRLEDTWEWDGKTWINSQALGPGYREGAVMAFDKARGKTILFGGANEKFEILGDTWAWDGTEWSQVSTTGPAPRFPSTIVYDPVHEKVLLFSGHFVNENSFINFSDFWEWDGASWHEIIVEGEKPGSRNIAQMVFDPVNETVLLFGGSDNEFLGDLWSWDGMKWSQILVSGTPERSGMGGAYDPQRQRLVLFGGVQKPGGTAVTDTWEWDGTQWACMQGCK